MKSIFAILFAAILFSCNNGADVPRETNYTKDSTAYQFIGADTLYYAGTYINKQRDTSAGQVVLIIAHAAKYIPYKDKFEKKLVEDTIAFYLGYSDTVFYNGKMVVDSVTKKPLGGIVGYPLKKQEYSLLQNIEEAKKQLRKK